jgi:hypothetical protein
MEAILRQGHHHVHVDLLDLLDQEQSEGDSPPQVDNAWKNGPLRRRTPPDRLGRTARDEGAGAIIPFYVSILLSILLGRAVAVCSKADCIFVRSVP